MRAGDVEDENPNRTIWIVVVGAGERDVEIALRAGLRGLCGERNGRDQQAEQQPHLSVESQKFVGIRPAMHPGWLRCSSFEYSRYAHSSRLAIRAPRRPRCSTNF